MSAKHILSEGSAVAVDTVLGTKFQNQNRLEFDYDKPQEMTSH